jgi:hypothetical protein
VPGNPCAERVGFEPTDPRGSTVFKTVAFVLSATAPRLGEATGRRPAGGGLADLAAEAVDPVAGGLPGGLGLAAAGRPVLAGSGV